MESVTTCSTSLLAYSLWVWRSCTVKCEKQKLLFVAMFGGRQTNYTAVKTILFWGDCVNNFETNMNTAAT
jgi:hypothetical protein